MAYGYRPTGSARTREKTRNPAGRVGFTLGRPGKLMGRPDPTQPPTGSGSGRVLRVGFSSLVIIIWQIAIYVHSNLGQKEMVINIFKIVKNHNNNKVLILFICWLIIQVFLYNFLAYFFYYFLVKLAVKNLSNFHILFHNLLYLLVYLFFVIFL